MFMFSSNAVSNMMVLLIATCACSFRENRLSFPLEFDFAPFTQSSSRSSEPAPEGAQCQYWVWSFSKSHALRTFTSLFWTLHKFMSYIFRGEILGRIIITYPQSKDSCALFLVFILYVVACLSFLDEEKESDSMVYELSAVTIHSVRAWALVFLFNLKIIARSVSIFVPTMVLTQWQFSKICWRQKIMSNSWDIWSNKHSSDTEIVHNLHPMQYKSVTRVSNVLEIPERSHWQ